MGGGGSASRAEQSRAEPGTMIQLPSNFSLPLGGPLSSKSFGGEMWLKLELPLPGEAEGQEGE